MKKILLMTLIGMQAMFADQEYYSIMASRGFTGNTVKVEPNNPENIAREELEKMKVTIIDDKEEVFNGNWNGSLTIQLHQFDPANRYYDGFTTLTGDVSFAGTTPVSNLINTLLKPVKERNSSLYKAAFESIEQLSLASKSAHSIGDKYAAGGYKIVNPKKIAKKDGETVESIVAPEKSATNVNTTASTKENPTPVIFVARSKPGGLLSSKNPESNKEVNVTQIDVKKSGSAIVSQGTKIPVNLASMSSDTDTNETQAYTPQLMVNKNTRLLLVKSGEGADVVTLQKEGVQSIVKKNTKNLNTEFSKVLRIKRFGF